MKSNSKKTLILILLNILLIVFLPFTIPFKTPAQIKTVKHRGSFDFVITEFDISLFSDDYNWRINNIFSAPRVNIIFKRPNLIINYNRRVKTDKKKLD